MARPVTWCETHLRLPGPTPSVKETLVPGSEAPSPVCKTVERVRGRILPQSALAFSTVNMNKHISTYISTMYFSKHFKRSEWCFKTHLKNPYSVCVSSVAGWSSTRVFSSRQRRRVLISWICNALEKRIFGSLVGLTLRWKLSPGRLCVGQEYPRKNHKESETRE